MSLSPYYQDRHCTIYHGDSSEILPQLDVSDLVLTDPPYGIGEAAGKNDSRGRLAAVKSYGYESWDNDRIVKELLFLVVGAGKNTILFGGNYYSDYLNQNVCWLVWDKLNTGDFADCELAWTTLPGAVKRISYLWNGMIKKKPEDRFHPTQKPLSVMEWCIHIADRKLKAKQETIIDPFMGSGTTLRASKNLNRRAIGIEQSEKYCEVAAKRLSQEVLAL